MRCKSSRLLLKFLAVGLLTSLTVLPATLAEQKPKLIPISPNSDPLGPSPTLWQQIEPEDEKDVPQAPPQWFPVDDGIREHQLKPVWQPVTEEELLPDPETRRDEGNDPPLSLIDIEARLMELRPQLYSFNRSIAFSDKTVGPDLAWRVPTGFQWTPHHWLDLTVDGFSRRADGQSFAAWNGGDAVAKIFVNIVNTNKFSFTLSQSFRSVSLYSDSNTPGASTAFGEGQSTGFRFGFPLGKNAGLAIGGEQIIQWDNLTDTGRTFYIAASKGWWLGSGLNPYPLAVANLALGTGRLASDPNTRFACTDTGENRTGPFSIDNQLCWAPVGSLALIITPYYSIFTEYNSLRWLLGASLAPIPEFPLRFTLAVNAADNIPQNGFGFNSDNTTWSFRFSIGF